VQASKPVKLDRQYLGNVPSCQTYNVWSLVRFAKMSGILFPSWLWFRFLNQTKINSFVRIQMLLPSLHNPELICALVPSTKTSLQLLRAALQPNWPYFLCTSIGIQHHQSYTNSSSRKALHPGTANSSLNTFLNKCMTWAPQGKWSLQISQAEQLLNWIWKAAWEPIIAKIPVVKKK
jgi:hypothetical protein